MTANIDKPVGLVIAAVCGVFFLAVYAKPLACAIGRRIDAWAIARIDRAVDFGLDQIESDEFRTSADEAMAQGNDQGRVWDRWSA